jgi:phage-related protein
VNEGRQLGLDVYQVLQSSKISSRNKVQFVRRLFGRAFSLAQTGDKHDAAKVLKGFGGAGVFEVVEGVVGGSYRAVYTVKFAEAVFVLHCFQKKSKRGIATPKEEMDIIHARLKIAEAFAKELRK